MNNSKVVEYSKGSLGITVNSPSDDCLQDPKNGRWPDSKFVLKKQVVLRPLRP